MRNVFLYIAITGILTACAGRKQNAGELSYAQQKKFNEAFFEASKQKALGNLEEATSSFLQAIKIDPSNHAVMYQLANLYLKQKNTDESQHWAEKSVQKNPVYNHWYYGQLGQIYNRQGLYAKSAGIFVKMIEQDPNRLSNYIEASNQLINAGEYKESIKILDRYQEKFGVDEESARKLEQLYLKLNKPEQALAEILKLAEACPDEVRYWGLLAETQMSVGKKADAEKSYLKMIALDSLNGYAHFGLADILRSKGEADASFEHLLAGFRDDRVKMANKLQVVSSYFVLMQKDEKSKTQVFRLAEALVKTHPNDAMGYVVYSDLYYALGSFSESRTYLLKALTLESGDYKYWQKLISIDERVNDMKLLEEDSRKALEVFPNIPALYIYNGFALIALKQFEKSVSISEEGLGFAIQIRDKIQLHLNMADAYHQMNNHEKSDASFESVLELDPENALALNNYAYFLAQRKHRLDDAVKMIQKALKSEPDNASYLDTYGWVLYQSAKYPEALKLLETALKLDPRNAEILEHVGDVYFKMGRNDDAQSYWRKAIDNKGDAEKLQRKIKEGIPG